MGDAGTLSVAAQDTLTGAGVQTVTGAKTFNHQKLKLRNPADTFSMTFDNPVITSNLSGEYMDSFDYLIHKSGSNYLAKRDNWSLESSNSDALTVLQYAVNNAHNKGAIGIKGESGVNYDLTGSLSIVDKNVCLFGFNLGVNGLVVGGGTSNRGGVTIRKNFAGTNPLINAVSTTDTRSQLANIELVGDNTAGSIGIDAKFCKERNPFLNNCTIRFFGTGLRLDTSWYTDFLNTAISNNDVGVHFYGTTTLNNSSCNTLKFYGGRVSANGNNLLFQYASAIDFFGTILEGASTGYTSSVITNATTRPTCLTFYGCSFEKNGETGHLVVDESGNNNSYVNCVFASNTDGISLRVRTGAKNIKLIGSNFGASTSAITQTVQIDSGASDTVLISNTKSTNTVGNVTLTDSGANTLKLGNAALGSTWNDRVPAGLEFGSSGTRLIESGTTVLLRDPGNTAYRNMFMNAICASVLRTIGSVDNITTGSSVTTYNLAAEDTVVTAPSDPAAGKIRRYPKVIDANNDGLFVKRKINGAVVEVQL